MACRCASSSATSPSDTTVTLLPVEGAAPARAAAERRRRGRPALVRARDHAPDAFSTGKGGHGALVLGPEHAGFCIDAGLDAGRRCASTSTSESADQRPTSCSAAGVQIEHDAQHDMTPGADGKLATHPLARRHPARHRRRRGRRLVGLLPVLGAEDPRLRARPAACARPASRCPTAAPTAASCPGADMSKITVLRPATRPSRRRAGRARAARSGCPSAP